MKPRHTFPWFRVLFSSFSSFFPERLFTIWLSKVCWLYVSVGVLVWSLCFNVLLLWRANSGRQLLLCLLTRRPHVTSFRLPWKMKHRHKVGWLHSSHSPDSSRPWFQFDPRHHLLTWFGWRWCRKKRHNKEISCKQEIIFVCINVFCSTVVLTFFFTVQYISNTHVERYIIWPGISLSVTSQC